VRRWPRRPGRDPCARPDVAVRRRRDAEIDGFALLELLEPEELPPAIVFVTAYDEHALRAFEARALDYVLKPFARERIHAASSEPRSASAR
jgi:two-component system LytT family response regulator